MAATYKNILQLFSVVTMIVFGCIVVSCGRHDQVHLTTVDRIKKAPFIYGLTPIGAPDSLLIRRLDLAMPTSYRSRHRAGPIVTYANGPYEPNLICSKQRVYLVYNDYIARVDQQAVPVFSLHSVNEGKNERYTFSGKCALTGSWLWCIVQVTDSTGHHLLGVQLLRWNTLTHKSQFIKFPLHGVRWAPSCAISEGPNGNLLVTANGYLGLLAPSGKVLNTRKVSGDFLIIDYRPVSGILLSNPASGPRTKAPDILLISENFKSVLPIAKGVAAKWDNRGRVVIAYNSAELRILTLDKQNAPKVLFQITGGTFEWPACPVMDKSRRYIAFGYLCSSMSGHVSGQVYIDLKAHKMLFNKRESISHLSWATRRVAVGRRNGAGSHFDAGATVK